MKPLSPFSKSEYARLPGTYSSRPTVPLAASGMQAAAEINVPCGLLTPDQAEALSAILLQTHACARIQNHHRISLFAADSEALCAALRASPELQPLLGGPDIISCPGTTFCSQAIVNTHAAEMALRAHLPADIRNAHTNFRVPKRLLACYNSSYRLERTYSKRCRRNTP